MRFFAFSTSFTSAYEHNRPVLLKYCEWCAVRASSTKKYSTKALRAPDRERNGVRWSVFMWNIQRWKSHTRGQAVNVILYVTARWCEKRIFGEGKQRVAGNVCLSIEFARLFVCVSVFVTFIRALCVGWHCIGMRGSYDCLWSVVWTTLPQDHYRIIEAELAVCAIESICRNYMITCSHSQSLLDMLFSVQLLGAFVYQLSIFQCLFALELNKLTLIAIAHRVRIVYECNMHRICEMHTFTEFSLLD